MPKVDNKRVADAIRCCDIENQGEQVSFPFSTFRDAMLMNDIFVDIRAIRIRWSIFVSKGIITEVGGHYNKGLLNVPEFNREFGYYIDTTIRTHTRTHTHINDVKTEAEE